MNAQIHGIIIYLYDGFVTQENCNIFYNGFVNLTFPSILSLLKYLASVSPSDFQDNKSLNIF